MKLAEEEQKVIRRYLLGDLDDEQCQHIEEHILTSPTFKSQVLIAEDELAEDYVFGTLPVNDKESFQRRLPLAREQNQRFETISALRAYAIQQPPASATANGINSERPWGIKLLTLLINPPVPVLLAAGIILAIGCAYWFVRSSRPNTDDLARRQEMEREVSRLNPPGNQPLPSELTPPAGHILSVTLTPNTVRDAGEQAKVELIDNKTVVQFRLKLPPDGYDSYRVTLHSSNGLELLRHDGLTHRTSDGSNDMIFNMPSSALPAGDYQLRLSGRRDTDQFEDGPYYYFRIVQRNSR